MGWFITPTLMNHLVHIFTNMANSKVNIESTSVSQQFNIQLMSAIALGLVPFILVGTTISIKKFKKREITTWDYFFQFCILLVVFLFGCYCKYLIIKISIEQAINHPIAEGVVNTLPLNQVKIHDWGFRACLIAGVLIVLFTRKRKIA